jgi:hypothetical protein
VGFEPTIPSFELEKTVKKLHTHDTNSGDSNLMSVEVKQMVLSTCPSVMTGVIENISHSTAKMCRSIIHISFEL